MPSDARLSHAAVVCGRDAEYGMRFQNGNEGAFGIPLPLASLVAFRFNPGAWPIKGALGRPFVMNPVYINNQEARVVLGALNDGTRRKPGVLRPYARELAPGSTREVREKAGQI